MRVSLVIRDIDDFLNLIGHLNIDLLGLLQFLYLPLFLLLEQFPPNMSVPELQRVDDGAMMAIIEQNLLIKTNSDDVLAHDLCWHLVQTLHGVGFLHLDVVDQLAEFARMLVDYLSG